MIIRPVKYEPMIEGEKPEDTTLNDGYVKDDRGFYEPGASERKDSFGAVVTHQDSRSFPTKGGLDTF